MIAHKKGYEHKRYRIDKIEAFVGADRDVARSVRLQEGAQFAAVGVEGGFAGPTGLEPATSGVTGRRSSVSHYTRDEWPRKRCARLYRPFPREAM